MNVIETQKEVSNLLNKSPDTCREQLYAVRNEREKRLFGQRNVMLQVVISFLSIVITLYKDVVSPHSNWLVISTIVLAFISGIMLIIAQHRLPRQQGEVIEKILTCLEKGLAPYGYISSTPRWYEQWCERFWRIPFILMFVIFILAVFVR